MMMTPAEAVLWFGPAALWLGYLAGGPVERLLKRMRGTHQ